MVDNVVKKGFKIAVIHDWLTVYAGSERVLEQMIQLYPEADLYALVDFIPEQQRGFLQHKPVQTSFIQNLPFAQKHLQKYLPLMPIAIEQFDLSPYQLILSSSHAVAKSVITGPDQLHICYIHSPMRYIWDMQSAYLKLTGYDKGFKSLITRYLFHKLRIWDQSTAARVDYFIANSHFIKRRVNKVYRRDAQVIYPPVKIAAYQPQSKQDFYITVSRLVPYKRVDLIIQAFKQMPDKKLIVIGEGQEEKKLRQLIGQATHIQMLGFLKGEALKVQLAQAKAFIFAAEEDFGIAPIEAQAQGTPIIAYAKGGALETVIEGKTGLFFTEQTAQAIQQAVTQFEQQAQNFDNAIIRQHAEQFSEERFRKQFKRYIQNTYLHWVDQATL